MQAWIAMIALMSGANNIPEPQMRGNYLEARQWASERSKPLAVFIGSGVSGWEKLSKDGSFDPKVYQILKDKYVCVYVDTNTEAGKNLAKQFAVDGKGLVIGDKTGATQAFHHSGDLSKELIAKVLDRYSEAKEAQSTDSIAVVAPKPVIQYQSYCPNCPNYVPGYGSNCPNGNCPK